jgi:hypothetical protein
MRSRQNIPRRGEVHDVERTRSGDRKTRGWAGPQGRGRSRPTTTKTIGNGQATQKREAKNQVLFHHKDQIKKNGPDIIRFENRQMQEFFIIHILFIRHKISHNSNAVLFRCPERWHYDTGQKRYF